MSIGRRQRIARIAHLVGDAAWWVFVIGWLMAMAHGGLAEDFFFDHGFYGVGLGSNGHGPTADVGWTAYTPLTEPVPAPIGGGFANLHVLGAVALVALAVTTASALVEAVCHRRWLPGGGMFVAPVAGATVIIIALCHRDRIAVLVVFVLVLLGVAIREVCSRIVGANIRRTTDFVSWPSG